MSDDDVLGAPNSKNIQSIPCESVTRRPCVVPGSDIRRSDEVVRPPSIDIDPQ